MTNELIRKEFLRLRGKIIKVFFKYATVDYNIKKSGKLIDCDDKFFILEDIKDGRQTYSYDFVISLEEGKE